VPIRCGCRMTLSPMRVVSKLVVSLLAAFVCASAIAVEMYRWVDDKGVTNISDVVPDKYKKSATKVDSTQFEPDEQSHRAAAARAAATASAAASSPAPALPPTSAGAIGVARQASSAASGAEDCATLQRRYKESQDCFGPQVRTVRGAINGARSDQCTVVVDPSPQCGLPPAPVK
jgi:hypothetical protein